MIKKISFWVRLAGWSGLISGSSVLVLYQYTHNIMFLINIITIILFSAYALATANDKRWTNTDWLLRVILISVGICFNSTDNFLRDRLFYRKKT